MSERHHGWRGFACPAEGLDEQLFVQSIARYLELEAEHATITALLKRRVAEGLGIALAEPLARERGLVQFVPIREGRPSLRHALLGKTERLG
jgi:hypothetical protein